MNTFEKAFKFSLLTTKCPHCNEVTKFGIVEQMTYLFTVFGKGIGGQPTYSILCSGCGYKEFVQEGDYTKWRELGRKYDDFSAGELSKEEFVEYVRELELPELRELLASSATWKCECGESNPPTFAHCWKCEAPSPSEPIEIKSGPINIAGWYPWKPEAEQADAGSRGRG